MSNETPSRGGPLEPRAVRRRRERALRRHVVALSRAWGGAASVSRAVGLSERTARAWRLSWTTSRLAERSRGPVPRRLDRKERRLVRAFLKEHGPLTGVDRLRGAFPGLSFAQATRTKREWLRQRRRAAKRFGAVLFWTQPGRVWAADFTDLDTALRTGENALLVVRDLASGATLAARPCRRKDARTARAVFFALFLEHGAPLALKLDNAKAFRGRRVGALLARFGVTALFSPRRRPSYNGGCERGLGWFKVRVESRAEMCADERLWSEDDVERTRILGNETLRPWGARGPTPGEAFAARTPIPDDERARFRAALARNRADEESRGGAGGRRHPAAAERAAVRRTLVDLGYVHIQSRRVSPPIQPLISAINP